jgi:hypothetical protein
LVSQQADQGTTDRNIKDKQQNDLGWFHFPLHCRYASPSGKIQLYCIQSRFMIKGCGFMTASYKNGK